MPLRLGLGLRIELEDDLAGGGGGGGGDPLAPGSDASCLILFTGTQEHGFDLVGNLCNGLFDPVNEQTGIEVFSAFLYTGSESAADHTLFTPAQQSVTSTPAPVAFYSESYGGASDSIWDPTGTVQTTNPIPVSVVYLAETFEGIY